LSPLRNGWELRDGKFEFYWFEGDCMPPSVLDALKVDETENNTDKYCFLVFNPILLFIVHKYKGFFSDNEQNIDEDEAANIEAESDSYTDTDVSESSEGEE
jgi:hypothetical protein